MQSAAVPLALMVIPLLGVMTIPVIQHLVVQMLSAQIKMGGQFVDAGKS